MEKRLRVIGFVLVLALFTAGSASADGGPHGGYTATTDGCAGCHRAHTADGPNLLIDDGTYALCVSCHGSTGSGANTNVDDGYYLSSRDDASGDRNEGGANTPDNAPLLGGGFVNYRGASVTSTHDPAGSETAAWGNGVARGVLADLAEGLTCASCHDPHGSPNYRIINEVVNGRVVAVQQVDETAKDYDTEQWGTGTSSVCAACHGAYHQTSPGQGSILDNGSYTHRVDMPYSYGGNVNPETVGLEGYTLPLAESGTGNRVVCMTCHIPHGTSAQMTGIADGGPSGTGTLPGNTTATDSALLRLDNRAVCQVCHQK
jgi:predicted CXXCH cytochrome family protein